MPLLRGTSLPKNLIYTAGAVVQSVSFPAYGDALRAGAVSTGAYQPVTSTRPAFGASDGGAVSIFAHLALLHLLGEVQTQQPLNPVLAQDFFRCLVFETLLRLDINIMN